MAPVMVWVVDTGTPRKVAANSVAAPPVSAQNPCMGVSLVIRKPMVRTMRQPPIKVPSAIAAWHASTTQNGTDNCSPRCPCEYSSTAMMPMVLATCRPKTANATKLKKAAHNTAYCGRSTRVDTMVTIELAASCNPLRKSNSSATAINPIRIGRPSVASTARPCLYLFDHDTVDLVGDVVEAIGNFLQVIIDFSADDEIHRV